MESEKLEKNWYVIHTYSGYENKVKANLEKKVHSMGMENEIFRVLVPMEDEVEIKDGKKKIAKKKVFPGYVLVELEMAVRGRLAGRRVGLSWYAQIVLTTSAWLILAGAVAIYLGEYVLFAAPGTLAERVLASLFQSVSCRTAGFNTLDIGGMTNISLLVMIALMFIGGSPASTAGGIKTTSLRTLIAFVTSQAMDRRQTVIGRFAVDQPTVTKALVIGFFASGIIGAATLLLVVTEGGGVPHAAAGGLFMDVLFESVSAFCTVGLSTGITPHLSPAGKLVITALMFIGRIGPIVMLSALQSIRREELHYTWPEKGMLIG